MQRQEATALVRAEVARLDREAPHGFDSLDLGVAALVSQLNVDGVVVLANVLAQLRPRAARR